MIQAANSWATKSATYPDTHVNNMACGVLTDAGTPYIYCACGSQATVTGHFRSRIPLQPCYRCDQPGFCSLARCPGMVLPGGFTVFNNKLYILGGFDTITNGGQGTNQIWQFTPSPAGWVQMNAVLPVPLGYIPTTTIGSLIYTGGGTDITAGVLTDTTNSLSMTQWLIPITRLPTYPGPLVTPGRSTSVTRCMSWVGDLTHPLSNEVDIYDPVS